MPYFKRDLIEASGLPDRTIRNYIQRGLIPPPRGYGMAAEYDEQHMIRAVTIGRMRAQGAHIDAITAEIDGWTTARFKRYVRSTNPAPAPAADPPPPATAPAPEPPLVEADPVLPGAAPRPRLSPGAHAAQPIERDAHPLPDAPAWRLYSLVTGLALMVDADAPPVVHRIAAEILDRYGPPR